MSVLLKITRGFRQALRGLGKAYVLDHSIRIEVGLGVCFLLFGAFFWPLSIVELLFLCLAYALILSIELLNTAFETSLEKLHPHEDEVIGMSKDIACAAVFIAVLFAAVVLGTIALGHWGYLA